MRIKQSLIIALLIVLVVPNNIFAQNNNHYTDSLISILDTNTSYKGEVYNKLSRYYYTKNFNTSHKYALLAKSSAEESNNIKQLGLAYKNLGNLLLREFKYDSAYNYYHKSFNLFKKINYTKGEVQVLNNMALINDGLSQYDLAIKAYLKAYQLDSTNNEQLYATSILSNLGGVYFSIANYDSAMYYYNKSLQLQNKANNKSNIAATYINLGMIYESLDRYDKVFEYYRKAETIFEQNGDSTQLSTVYHNLGNAYLSIYSYDRSLKYFNKALQIRKKSKDTNGIISTLNNIVKILIIQKKYKLAEKQLQNTLDLCKRTKYIYGEIFTKWMICDLYLQQHKYKSAIKLAEETIPKAKSIQVQAEIIEFYDILRKSYLAINNYQKAYNYSEAYHSLNDSINNSNTAQNIETIRLSYEIRKHLIDNKLLKKEKSLNEAKLKQSNTYINTVSAVLVIFLILLIIIYYQYRFKKRQSSLLLEEKIKLNKVQNELQDFNEKLQSEVERRTKEIQKEVDLHRKKDIQLKKALKDAEDANYLKNAFLSNMSHEIRTPLNGIIGFASLLEIELSLIENKELHEYAVGIEKSGERLLHLLNNIIDISRIEANDLKVTLQECDINSILTSSSELYRFKANEKGVTYNLSLAEIPKAYGDEQSISKIVIDIIDNAIKYTEKGFINITNGYLSETEEIYIRIKDTGIGIDKAYLPKIFEAFRQESLGYSRQFQGAGLGLPLAKRLLELMSGRINVKSEKGKGTEVTIYLPSIKKKISNPNGETVTIEKEKKSVIIKPSLQKNEKEIQILLVEDDRMNRLVISKMLTGDWQVSTAIDGEETLQIVDNAYKNGVIFDIMLFDINLPSPWDGVKLMKTIKKKYKEYETIPFIAQTAYAMKGDKESLLADGFDDYISKPIQQAKLLKIIYNYLEKKNE